jgi:hypothetical protein
MGWRLGDIDFSGKNRESRPAMRAATMVHFSFSVTSPVGSCQLALKPDGFNGNTAKWKPDLS